MKSNITFRCGREADTKELARVKFAVWKTTYQRIYPKEKFDHFDYKKQAERFNGYILDDKGIFYIAEDKMASKIIGYCYAGMSSRGFQKDVPEIILLYVLKEYQYQGIGKKFFEMSKNFLRRKGYKSFIISCNKYNYPAQKFYEKMGGKIIHTDDDNVDKSLPQIKYLYEL